MTSQVSTSEQVFAARRTKRLLLFTILILLVLGVAVMSVSAGQFSVPVSDLGRVLSKGPLGARLLDETVVWRIRIPRVLLGLLVGAALGVGGALMQAVFANPLAEPSVIGVTSGAGVGAAFVLVTGWNFLGGSTVPLSAFIAGLGLLVSISMAGTLDLLALGDRAAGHVGIDVQRLRFAAITTATLLTAGAVSYAGLIGFVGLVIPHIVRTIVGPANKILIPASALGGAVLVAGADMVARTAVNFADLPIGIFEASWFSFRLLNAQRVGV
ncbi:FecCD family ABC transporter permease [Corynebacterium dentalis]|uniref:FecCD family ABC transporter permease n=1 Tax=Corynebacterium dentalis TaxID=2014528 RepID=UPI00289DE210|nr:iron chelate uptake ABC transporter family permease subunit [Corynebacterium dentalis]